MTDTERDILKLFHGDDTIRNIINSRVRESTYSEEQFFPFVPVGTNSVNQGNGKPYLPNPHRIVNSKTSGSCTIYHPLDSSFTKTETRHGITAIVRRRYVSKDDWEHCLKMAWERNHSPLIPMPWTIYDPSYSKLEDQHIYLSCKYSVAPSTPCVYVPMVPLANRDWEGIVEFHERVACGYYRGSGFRVPKEQTRLWEDQTRALLQSKPALKLKKWCETKTK